MLYQHPDLFGMRLVIYTVIWTVIYHFAIKFIFWVLRKEYNEKEHGWWSALLAIITSIFITLEHYSIFPFN